MASKKQLDFLKTLYKKNFYVDIETTGLFQRVHGVHQIAGFIEVNDKIEATVNINVRPLDDDRIEDSALEICGVTKEKIMSYPTAQEGHDELLSIMKQFVDPFNKRDKFNFVGYNCHKFDFPFLYEWFKKLDDKFFGSWFWKPSIDVLLIASYVLQMHRSELEDFKLINVAKYLGIEVDEARLHESSYDAWITRLVYKELQEMSPCAL